MAGVDVELPLQTAGLSASFGRGSGPRGKARSPPWAGVADAPHERAVSARKRFSSEDVGQARPTRFCSPRILCRPWREQENR
jgi:hypothetical protein